jgi:lipopolysaccharide transport system permease protein
MSSAPDGTFGSASTTADLWLIEPRQHGALERVRELWQYRYLWWYFAAETITSQFKRSKLGWLWLLLRVAGPVGLNSVIFGGVLGVSSGGVPYFLFFLCGTTTWVLFERSLLFVTRSLEENRRLVTKVYFPRLILPLAAVAPGLLYLVILLMVIVGTVLYFHRQHGVWYVTLRPELLVSVAAIAVSLIFTVAVGLWTSVLQARYRDIRYGLRYVMPFWFYFTPIIYPVSTLPENLRWVVAINPMAPVVEAFKWGTLGAGHLTVASIVTSLSLITVTLITGVWFFSREEAASIDKL